MLKCSRCRKPLEAKDGTKFIGLHIKVSIEKDAMTDLIAQSLGKYSGYMRDNGNSFEFEANFCYECWLDSLFQGDRTGLIDQMAEQARR